ncbi:MAG: MFS transporter [Myxococcales bacterium]|nr:MFS transporter [Myxococcales bacterium]
MKELIEAFKALRHAPRALWLVIFAYAIDSMAYFGVLPLMKAYLGTDIGVRPELASTWVSVFTGSLTVVMLFAGGPAEKRLGIRAGIAFGLLLCVLGRALYAGAPFVGGAATVVIGLAVVALGEGVVQPVAYAGVKRYTSAKDSPMAYAMLYATMNLGAAIVGPISAHVRTTWDAKRAAGTTALSGFNAVNVVGVAITATAFVGFFFAMTKRAEAAVVSRAPEGAAGPAPSAPAGKSPFRDARFLFFIFALLPVRTLFAHQWLTMPEYVLRSYSQEVADKMEWLVDSINPAVIFFGVPTITALTKRFHVVTMMIVGSLVSAASTFLLCFGPSTSLLITYFVIFSIGESLWSSRFLEYSAELAPEGRVAQYMGVANMPWFAAKTTTGLYSGWVLERFCPATGPQRTGTMWLIYGAIAMASPLLLIAGRKWVQSGMAPAPAR